MFPRNNQFEIKQNMNNIDVLTHDMSDSSKQGSWKAATEVDTSQRASQPSNQVVNFIQTIPTSPISLLPPGL